MDFRGKVISGVGEGAYYVSAYSKKFKEILGWEPYPGTLNVCAEANLVHKGIYLPPFDSFSGVRVIPCRVSGKPAAIAIPDKTRHKGIIEIISTENLRKSLSLEDGDTLTIQI
jgi:riboflavin kinase, archaea type